MLSNSAKSISLSKKHKTCDARRNRTWVQCVRVTYPNHYTIAATSLRRFEPYMLSQFFEHNLSTYCHNILFRRLISLIHLQNIIGRGETTTETHLLAKHHANRYFGALFECLVEKSKFRLNCDDVLATQCLK